MLQRQSQLYALVGGALTLAIFAIDLATPYGFTFAIIPYLVAISIVIAGRSRPASWYIAGLAIAATVIGYLIKAPELVPDVHLANRLGIVVTLTVMAFVSSRLASSYEDDRAKHAAELAEQRLQGSEGLVNSVIENVPVGFLIKNADHSIVRVNNTYLDWYELKRDEIVGIPSHVVHGSQSSEDSQAMYAQERETLAKGTTSTRRVKRRFSDGRIHTVSVTKFPIYDDAGQIVQVGSVTVDMTDQVEARSALETQERLLNSIVDNLPVALVVKDTESRRTMVNSTYCRWYGVTPEHVLGQTHADTRQDENPEIITEQERQVIDSGETISRETVRLFADGKQHHLMISKYPIYDENGAVSGTASISVDLSDQIAARRELQVQERLLNSVFDNMPVGLVVKDLDGRHSMVNKTYCEWFGRSAEEFIGKRYEDFFDDAEEARAHDMRVATSGETSSREADRLFSDGEIHNIAINKFATRDENAEISGVASFITDLTKQVQARQAQSESEARFKDFAEVSADWLWEMDEDLKFSYFSERSKAITGLDHHDFIGKTRHAIATDDIDDEKWRQHFADLDNRRTFRDFEYSFDALKGKRVTVRISGKPVFDPQGNFLGYRGTGTDVTEQRQSQAARVEALAVAEKANRAKSEFLATMSHEFRTPLNAILGFSDILANQYLGPPDMGKFAEYAADINASATHLLALVNDLLDISAIEAGKTKLEKAHLSVEALLADCLNTVAERAASKNISLSIEMPADVKNLYADRRAVKQIVLNLLSNAVKFTPLNGRVSVSATQKNNGHEICISDTGPGIPNDRLNDIINPFTKGEAGPYMTDKGWGLGLSITNSLVDLHGGQLTINSTLDEGTSVTVSFPGEANAQPC